MNKNHGILNFEKGGIPSEADKLLTGSIKKDHPYPPQITKFVSAASRGVEFGPVVKPINFTPLIVFTFFVGSIGTLVWTLRKVIFNRIPAAILVIGFCVITTSGYTFCQIRGAPMKGRDGKYSFVMRTIHIYKGPARTTYDCNFMILTKYDCNASYFWD